MIKQLTNRSECFLWLRRKRFFECVQPERSNIHGGTFQRLHLSGDGCDIKARIGWLEPLGRDSVDRSTCCLILHSVPTNTWIIPITYIDCSVSADGHIGRPKPSLFFTPGFKFQKYGPLKRKTGSLGFRFISKNLSPSRLANQQESVAIFGFKSSVLSKRDSRWRTVTVNVSRWNRARVFLSPFGNTNWLPRSLVRHPAPRTISRRETGVPVFHQPSRSARRWVIIVSMKNVSE